MADIVRCINGSLPRMCLGLPLGASPKRLATWRSVIDKISCRLHTRKGKLLSLGGRFCFAKEKKVLME